MQIRRNQQQLVSNRRGDQKLESDYHYSSAQIARHAPSHQLLSQTAPSSYLKEASAIIMKLWNSFRDNWGARQLKDSEQATFHLRDHHHQQKPIMSPVIGVDVAFIAAGEMVTRAITAIGPLRRWSLELGCALGSLSLLHSFYTIVHALFMGLIWLHNGKCAQLAVCVCVHWHHDHKQKYCCWTMILSTLLPKA